jgi:hypothetical protein
LSQFVAAHDPFFPQPVEILSFVSPFVTFAAQERIAAGNPKPILMRFRRGLRAIEDDRNMKRFGILALGALLLVGSATAVLAAPPPPGWHPPAPRSKFLPNGRYRPGQDPRCGSPAYYYANPGYCAGAHPIFKSAAQKAYYTRHYHH